MFKTLAFKNLPRADPSVPESRLSSPDSPLPDWPELGDKMPSPRSSRMPPSPDPDAAGFARPCSALGIDEISCARVLCWAPAALWLLSPLEVALSWGWVNDLSWLALSLIHI